jgi:hypothetical protein
MPQIIPILVTGISHQCAPAYRSIPTISVHIGAANAVSDAEIIIIICIL